MPNLNDQTERWISQINDAVYDRAGQSHGSNLLTKLHKRENQSQVRQNAMSRIVPAYIQFQNMQVVDNSGEVQYDSMVGALNTYLSALNTPECDVFPHQSDFKSSVIPEFFFIVYKKLICALDMPFVAISQKDIAIELTFDSNGNIVPKKKRMDMAVLKECTLMCNGITFDDFYIPIVAAEIKTNLDKNMLAGIEHSVESMKRTFPKCVYYVITELSDMAYDRQNYAATGIDEIYILRKQRRSQVRLGNMRNNVDNNLVKTILENSFTAMQNSIIENQPLHERMIIGKLINGGNHDVQ